MGQLVYILGKSGSGKSFSMRNLPKNSYAVINVQGKILPFKGSGTVEQTRSDESEKIIKALNIYAKTYKIIVIDDYQYTMANEFMRRSYERGFDKFTEIGRHAWDIANAVCDLPNDVIVYIMCHTDRDDEGHEKIKTIGKLLDEKICLEGMSTIVLKTHVSDGVYSFLTQTNGKDTAKSPADMFPSYAIENDLNYVDAKIRNYYDLGEHVNDEVMQEMDEQAKNEDIKKDDGKKSRRRGEAAEEKPKRERKTREEVEEANAEAVVNNAVNDDEKETDFDEVETPKVEQLPRRTRKDRNKDEQDKFEEAQTVETETKAAPRRRKARGETEFVEMPEELAEEIAGKDEEEQKGEAPARRRRR